jgi:predicted deacylase
MTGTPRALTVGHLSAEPGARAFGAVPVDLGTATVEIPVVIINGAMPGPRVGVTAGIHGAEYVSIAALRRVAMSLDPATMTGSLVASLVSNPAAFAARSIYVDPLDGRNLNRSFPGDPGGSPTERLAAWLYANVIAPSDRFIDCHCGDLNEALVSFTGIEETGDADIDRVTLAMAEAYGLDYLVYGPTPGSTTTAAAAAGIPAVLGEVGGQGRWPEEDVALHAAGLRRALHAAGLIPLPDDGPRRATRVLRAESWLRSETTGFWHPAVEVGERVRAGQPVGEVQDAFGAVLQGVTAPLSGVVLFIVSSLAMNAADPLLAIAD